MSEDIQSSFTLDIEDLVAKLNEASARMEETAHKMEEGWAGVGEAVEGIQHKISQAFEVTGAALAYEAIEKVVEVFKEGAEQATEMEHASLRLGITMAEYQGLELAADQAGVGMDRLTRAGVMLDAKLNQAREGNERLRAEFLAAGVSASELADKNFRGADALVSFGQHADNTAVQMQLVGVRNSEVMAVLPQLAQGWDALADAAQRHGAISEEQADRLHELHAAFAVAEFETKNYKLAILSDLAPAMEVAIDWFREFVGWVKGLVQTFKDDFMPVFDRVAEAFRAMHTIWNQNTEATDGFAEAWNALTGGLSVGEFLIKAVAEALAFVSKAMLAAGEISWELNEQFSAVWEKTTLGAQAMATAVTKALHMDFSGATKAWEDYEAKTVAIDKRTVDEIRASRQRLRDEIAVIDAPLPPSKPYVADDPEKEERKPPKGNLPDLGKKDKDDPTLDALKLELEEARKGSEERIALAYEVAARMVDIGKGTTKEAIAAEKVIMSALKEKHDLEIKLAEEAAKAENQEVTEGLKNAQKVLDEEYKSKEISADQYAKLSDTVTQAELQNQLSFISKMEDLNKEDQLKMKALAAERVKVQQAADDQIAEHSRKKNEEIEKSWMSITQPITAAYGNMFNDMVKKHESFHKAFKNLEGSLISDMLNATLKMAEDWAAKELAKTAASQFGTDARGLLNKLAVQTGMVTDDTAASATISTSAAEGAAAAMASTAAIPIIGPELAPEAGAAMYAGIMAYDVAASAEGGFDIPSGVNPLTQLHSREMVLPAPLADTVRDAMTNHSGAGSSGEGGETHHHYNFNVHSMDSSDVGKFFNKHAPRLVRALHEETKRFNTPLHGKK